jgi:lipid A oxidase
VLRSSSRTACRGIGIAFLAAGCVAHAGELTASVYGGKAWTSKTDVTLQQPGGTDLKFESVAWDDQSFESPLYWGIRLTWWSKAATAGWGVALDFTHTKALADPGQSVQVSGTRGGTPVSGKERLGNTFGTLEFTHGLNTLHANAMYRWSSWRTAALGEVRPYVGAGLGVALPHVEVSAGGQSVDEYQITGAAYQGLAGLDVKTFERASLFVEYKLSRAEIRADLPGGGSVQLKPWTQHAVFGLSYHF